MATYTIQPQGSLALDSYMDKAASTARNGFRQYFRVGDEAGADTERGILEIPLRAIPAGAVVGSGTKLELNVVKEQIDACDSHVGWNSSAYALTTDTGDKKQGAASIKGEGGNAIGQIFGPVVDIDVTDKFTLDDALIFWLYVSDVTKLLGVNPKLVQKDEGGWLWEDIEGTVDGDGPLITLSNGWNFVVLKFNEARATSPLPATPTSGIPKIIESFDIDLDTGANDLVVRLDNIFIVQWTAVMNNLVVSRLARQGWDQPTVTWDNFKAGSPWTAAGGDEAISVPSTITFNVTTPEISELMEISGSAFETIVQDALDNRGGLMSLMIKSASAETNAVGFASGQHSDRSKAPKLTVVTTETNLGHVYTGGKRAVASWVTAGNKPISAAKYMGIGVGVSPEATWKTRRRLLNEVYRVPIAGSTLDLLQRRVDVWGSFPAGKGTSDAIFPLTEVALFAGDTSKQIEDFESLTDWAVTTGTLTLDTSDPREGAAAFKWAGIPDVGGPYTLTKTVSIDLNDYNLDDYLAIWFDADNTIQSQLHTSKVILTDENGTWEWINPFVGIIWVTYPLKFDDADVKPAGATGPGTITQIQFEYEVGTVLEVRYDHMRVYKAEEEILAVAQIADYQKSITNDQKFAVRLDVKRSTDG